MSRSIGGEHWVALKGGLPTIAVRDLEIQRRENDLALATFGRGFYILDDYTPLRGITETEPRRGSLPLPGQGRAALHRDQPARVCLPLDKAFQGDNYFIAPNPAFGAVFTYHLKDGLKTRQERRLEAEKKADEEQDDVALPELRCAPRRGRGARSEHHPHRARCRRQRGSAGDGSPRQGPPPGRVGSALPVVVDRSTPIPGPQRTVGLAADRAAGASRGPTR